MSAKSRNPPRLSYLVKWVERGLRLRLDLMLEPFGVTTPEYTALSVLRERDGLSSAQLARRVFVSAQAMNQLVIRLERRGLIARTPSAAHQKTMNTSLTDKGAALLAACDRATLPIDERALSCLPKGDATALRRALAAIVDSFDERRPRQEKRSQD